MAKQNKILIIIIMLVILIAIGFGIYQLIKKEKYKDPEDPPGTQNYDYQYPNGLCKDCDVYEKCMKGCYGLHTNCDSMCFSECNK